jgi:hypothetical protein
MRKGWKTAGQGASSSDARALAWLPCCGVSCFPIFAKDEAGGSRKKKEEEGGRRRRKNKEALIYQFFFVFFNFSFFLIGLGRQPTEFP